MVNRPQAADKAALATSIPTRSFANVTHSTANVKAAIPGDFSSLRLFGSFAKDDKWTKWVGDMKTAVGVDERMAAARYIGVGEASSLGGGLVQVVLAIVKVAGYTCSTTTCSPTQI
jgi:hypothetical protein